MPKFESFTFSVEEYSRNLTEQHHNTVKYLCTKQLISENVAEELLTNTIVTPVKNSISFGQRILNRFFGEKDQNSSYVFVVAKLEPMFGVEQKKDKTKPKLKLVDTDNG